MLGVKFKPLSEVEPEAKAKRKKHKKVIKQGLQEQGTRADCMWLMQEKKKHKKAKDKKEQQHAGMHGEGMGMHGHWSLSCGTAAC